MIGDNTNRQPGESIFALLLLVFSVTAFWQSYAISGFQSLSSAGIFPMLASATMVGASLFILLGGLSKPATTTVEVDSTHGSESSTTTAELSSARTFFTTILPVRTIVVIALITAYVIAMPLLGFIIASGLFLFSSFTYLWRKSLLLSLILTLVTLASVYVVFRKLFQVVLPEGILVTNWF